jgi:hypothetical protein
LGTNKNSGDDADAAPYFDFEEFLLKLAQCHGEELGDEGVLDCSQLALLQVPRCVS